MLRLRSFFRFHIIELVLRRGMGLAREAEFGGNCHLVVFVFDLSVSLFWVFRASMGSCS